MNGIYKSMKVTEFMSSLLSLENQSNRNYKKIIWKDMKYYTIKSSGQMGEPTVRRPFTHFLSLPF